jgi:hypothetical protein
MDPAILIFYKDLQRRHYLVFKEQIHCNKQC